MAKKAVNVSVRPRGKNDTPQRMIKRFLKKVKKFKVLESHRDSLRYTKRSEKKRREREKRDRVLRKLAEENKIKDN